MELAYVSSVRRLCRMSRSKGPLTLLLFRVTAIVATTNPLTFLGAYALETASDGIDVLKGRAAEPETYDLS